MATTTEGDSASTEARDAGPTAPSAGRFDQPFGSILFLRRPESVEAAPQPDYFRDLNLDQIVEAVIASRAEYDLKPFFHVRLSDPGEIRYRQQAFADLKGTSVYAMVMAFTAAQRQVREQVARAEKCYYDLQKWRWVLDAAGTYCAAVGRLADDLAGAALASDAFASFRAWLARHVASPAFQGLDDDVRDVSRRLDEVRYCVLVTGGSLTVRRYEDEPDYSAEVEATFDKFRQGDRKSYADPPPDWSDMNHVEAKVLEFAARLFPDAFGALRDFIVRHADFVDPTIAAFDREVQFFMAVIDHAAGFERAGLTFCTPEVGRDKVVRVEDGFDIALAGKRLGAGGAVVCNDFALDGPERILVVSGPNQGGKTTLARMFGQLHHLGVLGCIVPGRSARLHLFDQLFTHFEREESVANLRGKLQDDLVRVHDYLERATSDSILIMNEIFTSTTLQDATLLSERIMATVIARDLLSVWVTFIDELSRFGPQTVSMVSTVVPDRPAERTFKVVRRPADGLAYALSIAEKYRLTSDRIRERLA